MQPMLRIFIVNMIFFILMLFVNYSSATNVGDVANEQPALIQPASYAFSIWGLIYVLLFLWILKGLFARGEQKQIFKNTQVLIPVNFLLNSAWIITFTQEYIFMSTVVIFLLLLSLIILYRTVSRNESSGMVERIPFSIYIGWVSVASVVNVFTGFARSDATQFLGVGELGWTIAMLILLLVVAVMFTRMNRDVWYPLVFIWAYLATYIRSEEETLRWVILISIIILAINVLVQLIQNMKNPK
ncbi:peptidoglycan biosynthesis protein MviN/MurJ (putative lipid II flippase) [Geomicrobium halophilum]|uniref:Peptidoglycan biosynthesis protein MviN/MurJ (Putative lipid II flippase) n=1 Tax=Geomicrobium halophilum TaxID=549000 RepID=A0A841PLB4_9BACL|nr:tryptophan-rich sensory protein [Geomicrobium halophilum]MBB6449647.1 peptidoglycan biosynthesis protein MviN/MurJ (putative lipid II flippase) [Geomicrobium halophilum]